MTTNRRHLAAALNIILAAVVGVAALIGGMTHDAPQGGWMGPSDEVAGAYERGPFNVPTWDDVPAAQRPGCEPMRDGILPADVLVSDRDGNLERLSFDAAWALVKDHPVGSKFPAYVVGMCR